MVVIEDVPSGSVDMFALLRAAPYTPGGGSAAPAWASPTTGSFSRNASVSPKLFAWAFQFSSVKPRLYDQSCIRLCIANRFVTAAATSKLWPGTKAAPYGVPGLQSARFQAFVHGKL